MNKCKQCGSFAINHNCHGRDGSEPDLCDVAGLTACEPLVHPQQVDKDVCFWRNKAEQWKNNHDNIANKLRLFTQRNDLPVDRLPAYNYVLGLETQIRHYRESMEGLISLADQLDEDASSYTKYQKAKKVLENE